MYECSTMLGDRIKDLSTADPGMKHPYELVCSFESL